MKRSEDSLAPGSEACRADKCWFSTPSVWGVLSQVSQVTEFWQRPFRLIEFNLRKIDVRGLDVKRLVAQVIDYGANAVLIHADGALPGHPNGPPGDGTGDPVGGDVMGQVVRECHRQGLKVLVRVDVSRADSALYDRHTDWFQVSGEGKVKRDRDSAMLLTCFQGPYWQEHGFGLIDEIMSRYPVDGFFYDHLWYGHCTCRRCREAFREKTGMELPWHEDWSDPWWRAYVRFRHQEVAGYAQRLHSFVRRRNPRAILTGSFVPDGDVEQHLRQAGGLPGHMADAVDVLACAAWDGLDEGPPRYPLLPGQQARMGQAIRESQPVCIILSYSGAAACPRAAQPPAQLAYDLMQIVAHGAQPCVQLSGTFDQGDRRGLPTIKTVYRYLRDHAASYENLVSPARVALVYSQVTVDFYGRDDGMMRCLDEFEGFYEALVASHVQFDLLHDAGIDAARLAGYQLLILPNVAALSDAQSATVDRYVEAGGHLVASFETGLHGPDGQPRDAQALKCLGRFPVDRLECSGGYLRILDRELLAGFEHSDLLGLRGTFLVTGPLDSAGPQITDLHLTPPTADNAAEQANREQESDAPGLVLTRYGAGEAAYLPWQVGKLYHLHGTPECRQVIVDLVRRWVPPLATTDAPGSVEMTVHHPRGDRNRCLVHLLNATAWQGRPLTEIIPVHDVSLWVRGPYVAARELSTQQDILLEGEEGGVRFVLPRLESFAAIELVAAGVPFASSF